MLFLLPVIAFVQQQVDEAVHKPPLRGRAEHQLLLHLGLQVVGHVLAGAQQQLVGRDLQRGAQLHQRFQAGNRAGIFDVGDVDSRKLCTFGQPFLRHSFFMTNICYAFT